MECIHFPQGLEALALLHGSELRNIGRPILRELCAQRVRNPYVGDHGSKQRRPLGECAAHSDSARGAALYRQAR